MAAAASAIVRKEFAQRSLQGSREPEQCKVKYMVPGVSSLDQINGTCAPKGPGPDESSSWVGEKGAGMGGAPFAGHRGANLCKHGWEKTFLLGV